MQIVTVDEGTPYVFALKGRLDTNAAPRLDEVASRLYARGVHRMVVDMSECSYVSSAGLRVIVAMQKRAAKDGSLAFRSVTPDVMEVFSFTGFDKVLTFI